MKVDHRFVEGIKLFNEGDYFECHEVIEDLWLETPSENPYRDLYKGVIQAAAALYQFERGIYSGALGLYETSVGYLGKYKIDSLGLDVENLIKGMQDCFKELKANPKATHLELPKNLIPVLKYEE